MAIAAKTGLPSSSAQQRPPRGATRMRFFILGLLVAAVTINYLDRAVVGIAAPAMRHDLGLDAAEMGVVFSAFSWSYFVMQIPAGILLDRFGARLIYFVALAGWSLFTLWQSLARGLVALLGMRLGLGVFESPCFPANGAIVGKWFPRRETGIAVGIFTAAEYVGLGFLSPVLFWIMADFGWRALFITTGGVGLIYAMIWWFAYRDPFASRRVNKLELDYIAAGGGTVTEEATGTKFEWANVRQLFRYRQMWGLCIGQFAVNSTLVFFLTWFPSYLATARHMEFIKAGFMATLPYIAGFFGILFAGWFGDWLIARGASLNLARKTPVVAGLVLASTIVTANYVQSNGLVIAILSVAFFAQAMSSAAWAVLPEVAPVGLLGLVAGLFNASANFAGIVTPLVIGLVVQATGSFVGALAFVGAVAAIGALMWIFVIGDIHRMQVTGIHHVPAVA
jgi:ACS family D-galactonate transporter-like MFS transporter